MRELAQKQNHPQQRSLAHIMKSNTVAPVASQDSHRETATTGRFAHDFSRIPVHAPAPIAIQPKLAVDPPRDTDELEPNHISEEMMRGPEPKLQRTCACGGGCPRCQMDEHRPLQTTHVASSESEQTAAPPIVEQALANGGGSLPDGLRADMEQRFGRDFGHVRPQQSQSPPQRSSLFPPVRQSSVPKLAITSPGDRYEQEADLAADHVLRSCELRASALAVSTAAFGVQRACQCGGTCTECQIGHESQHLQLKPEGFPRANSPAPPIVHDVLNSPGQPLDPRSRAFMEPRFNFDFSHVRVHSGAEAEQSARVVNALAYTVGRHIVFGANQYAPSAQAGRRLLAHELAHVVQQNGTCTMLQREPDPDKKDKHEKETKKGDSDCKYTVNYAKNKDIDCDTRFQQEKGKKPPGKLCGRAVLYDIESVTAAGKCPPFKGLKLTETKQVEPGKASCWPPGYKFQHSSGCKIESDGKLKGCTDLYSLCAPLEDINARTNAGCENTYTQKIFIGGKEAETHSIHFEVEATPSSCTTTMTRDGKPIPN